MNYTLDLFLESLVDEVGFDRRTRITRRTPGVNLPNGRLFSTSVNVNGPGTGSVDLTEHFDNLRVLFVKSTLPVKFEMGTFEFTGSSIILEPTAGVFVLGLQNESVSVARVDVMAIGT